MGDSSSGTLRKGVSPDTKTSVVFYASLEGLGSLEVDNAEDGPGFTGDVNLKGESEGLGQYKLVITQGRGSHPKSSHPSYEEKPLDRTFVQSFSLPSEVLWQAKQIMFTGMKEQIDEYVEQFEQDNLPPPYQVYTIRNDPGEGNMHMIQKVFQGDFEFDIIFSSGSGSKEYFSSDV